MRKQHAKWLAAELPDLVVRNILSPEAADRLRDYYGGFDQDARRHLAANALAILAALLIGSGIILLLTHNWAELSRPARAVFRPGSGLHRQARRYSVGKIIGEGDPIKVGG